MSLDRFSNKEQVKGNTPVYGKTLDVNPSSTNAPLLSGDIDGRLTSGIQFSPNFEKHIYGGNTLLYSSQNGTIPSKDSTPVGFNKFMTISLTPEKDLRDANILQGNYSIVYNFLHKINKKLKIVNISGDRTELELVGPNNAFSDLRQLIERNDATTFASYIRDFVLNFGENNLFDVTNIELGGVRVGNVDSILSYPTSIFNGIPTVFIPADSNLQNFDGLNPAWNPMVEVYNPAIGQSQESRGALTGRSRWFAVKRNFDMSLGWESGQKLGTDYNWVHDLKYTPILRGLKHQINTNQLSIEYKYFDKTITNYNRIYVKLAKPLDDNIVVNNIVDLDARIKESWVEKIIAFPSIRNEKRPDFSQPDFNIDLSDRKGSNGTEFETWTSLLDVDAVTSQQLINKYFSGSLGDVKLNIDYSDFQNFIHFSSATERVDNFRYKLQQIEKFNDRINLLESVSGSDALTNISQSMVRRDRIIGGFDEFEDYLYYNTDSNIYTHWSSSNFTIEPYPKSSTFPHVLRDSDSTEGVNWYNGVYASASLYDEFNDARLRNMIPIHLQEDERNEEYITFVDMIGQHFDIQWTYIKSLTDINEREEHPQDGMSNDLLASVAESLGWKLSNGYSDTNLWQYALGVESDGTLYQSGSLKSKPRDLIVKETWRRIVNTIPMLYKSKGSARSIKALLASYGIPQSFLQIREFGGPAIPSRKNVFEKERFVNKLQLSPSKYISNPWDDIQSDRPNSIEVIGKLPKQNYHILRLSDTTDNVDLFWDYDNETARIRLRVNSTDIISSSYVSYKERREVAVVLTSGSIDINAAWVDDWGEILANPTASLSGANSTFNSVWTSTGTVQVPGPTTDLNVNSYETASIQEVRYFRDGISNEIITEHAKNREAYFSDDNTTDLDIDTSYDKLMYRIFPDSGFSTNTSSIDSLHPNQNFTQSDSGLILSASLINLESTDLVGEVDTQFVTIPSMGALNLMNNKVRIESASLKAGLNPDKSNELSEFDYAPNDSNLLGTYFSTTDTVNYDIYNSEGYFEIDDWVGDPDKRYNDSYPLLKYRAKNYFQKYTSGTAIDLIMDMLARYDMSVFDQIKQLLPARVDWHKGILIEPHIFERNKYQRNRDITISRHHYEGNIPNVSGIITASRNDYDIAEIDLYDYRAAEYKYQTPTLSSSVDTSYPISTQVTSSTTLPTDFGSGSILRYNSPSVAGGTINYGVTNKIDGTHFTIDSNIYASASSATIAYSSSTSTSGINVKAFAISSSTIDTPSSGSFVNSQTLNDGDSILELSGSVLAVEQFVNSGNTLTLTIEGSTNLSGFRDSVNSLTTLTFESGVVELGSPPSQIQIDLGGVDLGNGAFSMRVSGGTEVAGAASFSLSHMSASTQNHQVADNIVTASNPSFGTNITSSNKPSITFNDGSGNKNYPILSRLSTTHVVIDTSSYAPNTSGSFVSSTLFVSSSNTQAITIDAYTNLYGPTGSLGRVVNTTYVNRSNGYWEYSPTGSTVLNHKKSKIYKVPKYFYSSDYSASVNLPNSTSMEYAEVQDTRLPLAIENLYYNGCRITSDSLTTDSPNTPDGGPVVEITNVDPNILVFSGQSENDDSISLSGANDRKVKTIPSNILLSTKKNNEKSKNRSKLLDSAAETKAIRPLPFVFKNTKPKLNLRPNSNSLLSKILKRFRF